MRPFHEHFRFNDRHQTRLLAERGIAGQRVRVGLQTPGAWQLFTHNNHRPPLGEARPHLRILHQPVTQIVQPLGYSLTRVPRQFPRAGIHFDARNDARIRDRFHKRRPIPQPIADRLVIKNRPADARPQLRRGNDQFPPSPPVFRRLRYFQRREPLVTGRIALIHRQQPLATCHQRLRRIRQLVNIHGVFPHCQLRISGKSCPFLSIYCLCSINLSLSCCFK